MWTYRPPIRHMQFVIEEVLDAPRSWAQLPAFGELDAATARAVVEEAGKFTGGVLAPLNASADLEGCAWSDGVVKTPAGYAEAYSQFVEAGWPSLTCDPEDGGQGLPQLLHAALNEMMAAANHAWTMYPGLLHGAYECLRTHGSDELRKAYLARVASGEWLATMNLTEPQAGSDLGLVRTRAEPQADGSFRITGNKIFISGGEHDLTPNIVHLVLARLPDAPAGTRGLSLFLVPKVLPDGSRNSLRCDGIEKKMGIKGSATCAMAFDRATGWLVGERDRGLAAMFVMMNSARLHVALQGLGHLQAAQQNAFDYAGERMQGRGRPIAEHPAVRRILWRLRALTEGGRVIAFWAAMLLDEAHAHPDEATRAEAESLVGLLTPVLKSFLTESGHVGASQALQVWGGYGYIHEYGIEQAVRDSRIAMVYEGTNEIQAIDLLQRKVLADGGVALLRLLAKLATDVRSDALREQVELARAATASVVAGAQQDAELPLRIADDYLKGVAYVLLAWAWSRSAEVAATHCGDAWYEGRASAARFGLEWLLPEAMVHWQRVRSGKLHLPLARAGAD